MSAFQLKPKVLMAISSLFLASALQNAQAVEYKQIAADKSTLKFSFKQIGVNVEGQFKGFTATVAFDPKAPQKASAKMDIPLAKVDAGSSDANDELKGKAWFNSAQFPVAQFTASQFKPLGGDKFEISGKLALKGKTQELTVPVTLKPEGQTAHLEGSFVLKRLDFAVGDGPWSDVSVVANEVTVRLHLVLMAP